MIVSQKSGKLTNIMNCRLAHWYPVKMWEKGTSHWRYYIISNCPVLQNVKKISTYAPQKKLIEEEDEEDSQILSQQQQKTNSSKLTTLVTAAVYIYNYCHSFVQYYIYQFLNIKQEQSKKENKVQYKSLKDFNNSNNQDILYNSSLTNAKTTDSQSNMQNKKALIQELV